MAAVAIETRASARFAVKQVLLYVAMGLFGILMLGPFILSILGSFKNPVEINAFPPSFFPSVWHVDNYVQVAKLFPLFPRWFANTLGLAIAVTILNVLFCAMAGYAFARLDFPGRNILFIAVLATLMIPLQVTLIPKYIMLSKLGLINTYPAVILPNISTPAGIFIMTQFMKAIPRELEEAARIDGASKLTIFRRVVLPLSGPALTTLAIFSFQGQWNDFLWPLIVLNSEHLWTLPIGLSSFSHEFATNTNWVLVGSFFATIPMVILVFVFQRFIVKGVATTGFK